MPTVISHAVTGYALSTLWSSRIEKKCRFIYGGLAVVVSVIPDFDALFMKWISYSHPFGHRGFSHSLFFALIVALLSALFLPGMSRSFPPEADLPKAQGCKEKTASDRGKKAGLFFILFFIAALHGILDAFTDGGLGIGFFIPFYNHRYFFPIKPIPVAPLSLSPTTFLWSLPMLLTEIFLLWTVVLAIIVYTKSRFEYRWVISAVLILTSVYFWVDRSI